MLLIIAISLAVLLVGMLFWVIILSEDTPSSTIGAETTGPEVTGSTETTVPSTDPDPTATTQTGTDGTRIETMYGVFNISEANADKLVHQQIVQKSVAMERFSMQLEQQEKELFRIYFGDSSQGDLVGYFRTETESI